jgi:hypothetical protein
MSENAEEPTTEPVTEPITEPVTGISDEQLPEDLQPTDDNPLAQPLDEDQAKSREELDMEGGKTPDEDDSAD